MKNKLIILALGAVLSTSVLAQTKPAPASKPYVLKGQIKGLGNRKVYLHYPQNDEYLTDSMQATNGAFLFKGTMANPDMYSINIEGKPAYLSIYMQPGTVTVTANQDSLSKATVTGSALDAVYKKHRKEMDEQVGSRLQAIEKKYAAMRAKPTDKLPDSLAKQQSLEVQAGFAIADSLSQQFIRDNPNTEVSAFIANAYYNMDSESEKLARLYTYFTPAVKDSYYGQKIKNLMADQAKVGLGKTAPGFTLADTTGKSVSLSSVKGKYILVDFWASWCGPCRKENPNVVAAYKKFHDKGFEILGVSLDTKKSLWEKAINADGLNWYHVSDLKGWKSDVLSQYVVKAVPTSFLLDGNGKIVAKNLRGEALHKKLAQLLNEK